MIELYARNINEAFVRGWSALRNMGVHGQSRNGPVLRYPGPVTTHYVNPLERVLFEPRRDCNHVFHLMEALWMLAGENDVRWLLQFNSKFDQFAEEGVIMHGAYGHRWRRHWPIDQLHGVIHCLANDKDTRQAVMQMWSAPHDLNARVKDKPCNTHIYFEIVEGKLNMLVSCRSNDVLWGAYGSNVVHFSILQELVAHAVGVSVGWYEQMSFNYHAYTALPMVREFLREPPIWLAGYPSVIPLLGEKELYLELLHDCATLMHGGKNFCTNFFQTVVGPMKAVYLARKAGQPYEQLLEAMAPCDWKVGLQQWIANRKGTDV